MHDQKIKAATPIPPAVRPASHKTSAAAAELLRSSALLPSGITVGVQEALNDLDRVIRAEKLARGGGLPPPPIAPKSPVGDNRDMEARITALEDFAQDARDRLMRIETKLDTCATKEDLTKLRGETREGFESVRSDMHKGTAEIIKWMIGTAVGLGVAAITVMTFVLNNAAPKTPAAALQPPIIINVPATPIAAPAPPAKP